MRIIVFSDTHGNFAAMHKIIKRNGDADLFIFLGDGLSEFRKLKSHYLDNNMICVKGNCDFDKELPESMVYVLPDGKRMFLAHGDKWGVNFSVENIYEKAKEEECQFALFGHTHKRYSFLFFRFQHWRQSSLYGQIQGHATICHRQQ